MQTDRDRGTEVDRETDRLTDRLTDREHAQQKAIRR